MTKLAAMMIGTTMIGVILIHWLLTNFHFESHDWILVVVLFIGVGLSFPARAAVIASSIASVWRKR